MISNKEKKKDMIRLYININNKCNRNCDFCCMWAGTEKKTFLPFSIFKKIIDSHNENFELQLEGGEPLLNDLLYLYMWYAYSTGRCKKIIISTNGVLLNKHISRLVEFSNNTNIKFLVKISINYYLYEKNENIIKEGKDFYLSTEFINNFNIRFNVRLRKNDGWLIEELKNNKIYDLSDIYYLQSYGKFFENKDYDKPIISQNIGNWFIYASDGKGFKKNLINRSNYEKKLK